MMRTEERIATRIATRTSKVAIPKPPLPPGDDPDFYDGFDSGSLDPGMQNGMQWFSQGSNATVTNQLARSGTHCLALRYAGTSQNTECDLELDNPRNADFTSITIALSYYFPTGQEGFTVDGRPVPRWYHPETGATGLRQIKGLRCYGGTSWTTPDGSGSYGDQTGYKWGFEHSQYADLRDCADFPDESSLFLPMCRRFEGGMNSAACNDSYCGCGSYPSPPTQKCTVIFDSIDTPGVWHDWRFYFRLGSSGRYKIWKDGVLQKSLTGNYVAQVTNIFKWIKFFGTNEVTWPTSHFYFVDELKVWKNREVAP